jgi:hypothetical protein
MMIQSVIDDIHLNRDIDRCTDRKATAVVCPEIDRDVHIDDFPVDDRRIDRRFVFECLKEATNNNLQIFNLPTIRISGLYSIVFDDDLSTISFVGTGDVVI